MKNGYSYIIYYFICYGWLFMVVDCLGGVNEVRVVDLFLGGLVSFILFVG